MSTIRAGEWLKTNEATKRLNTCRSHLSRLKKDGFLQPKIHYFKIGIHKTSPLLWNVDAIAEAMMKFTFQRGLRP